MADLATTSEHNICKHIQQPTQRRRLLVVTEAFGPYYQFAASQTVMSTDPYHAVQREIQTSLQTAAQLHASYVRIQSTAREDSEELTWARREVYISPCYSIRFSRPLIKS